MENIKKIEIENEKVFLKKSFDGWRVVHPYKNEDGSFNWFNFFTGGSYLKLIIIIVIVIIIVGVCYEYQTNLKYCNDFINNYTSMHSINNSIISNFENQNINLIPK